MRRHSIQRKILIILYSLVALFIVTIFLFQELLLKDSYLKLEENLAKSQHNRTQKALERDSDFLDNLLLDWSLWDDTYDFAETGSDEYVESNLGIDSLYNISLNFMLIFDKDGNLMWGDMYDFDEWESLYTPEFTERYLTIPELYFTKAELENFINDGKIKSGYIDTDLGLVKAHSRPILKSDGSGPPAGVMIIGKILNQSYFDHMKEIVQGHLTFHTEKEHQAKATLQQEPESLLIMKDDDNLRLYSLIDGLEEDEAFLLETVSDRTISDFGNRALRIFITTVVLSTLVFTLLFLFSFRKVISRPLKNITGYLEQYTRGHSNPYSLNLKRKDEIGILSRGIDHFIKELKKQATTDALTGLKNRHVMDTEIPGIWNILSRDHSDLTVILIDIDYFKKYNDAYGHQKGDECLKDVALILLKALNRNSDMAMRFGGEEFMVVLPATDSQGGAQVAERIMDALAESAIEHKGSDVSQYLTLSIGISSTIPTRENNLDKLIEQADKALYRSKKEGRNRITLYEE